MKTKILTLMTIFFIGCLSCCTVIEPGSEGDLFYRDFDLILVSINNESSLTDDEGNIQSCNIILFETTYGFETKYNTRHMYRMINTCQDFIEDTKKYPNRAGFNIDVAWLYNHKKGDIIHFDYMLKSKFFESPLLDENNKNIK